MPCGPGPTGGRQRGRHRADHSRSPAGAIAKILLPGRDPGGLTGTTLIGIAGAFVGGRLSTRFLDRPVQNHFCDLYTWGAAVAGSLCPLTCYRLLFGNSRD